MTFYAPDPQTSTATMGEVERIRALVMNLHGMLRGTDAAHLADRPIENIHRSLDRIEKAAARGRPIVRETRMSHRED